MVAPLIVSEPVPVHNRVPEVLLSKYVSMLAPSSRRLGLMSGNLSEACLAELVAKCPNLNVIGVPYKRRSKLLFRLCQKAWTQLRYAYEVFRARSEHNILFFIVGATLVLPMLVARILGKETVLFALGSPAVASKSKFGGLGTVILPLVASAERLCFSLTTTIAIDSPSVVTHQRLEGYSAKVTVIKTYVDTDRFSPRRNFDDRPIDFAFVSRLTGEKKVLELVGAFSRLEAENSSLKMLIGGSGPLEQEVAQKVIDANLQDNVEIIGWVSYEDMPEVLNKTRFLVLPSDTEGLPNIVIEAMACGTIVVGTRVGGIPDVIKDGVTGFLLSDNSVDSIADILRRALRSENLREISVQAATSVKQEYSFEAARQRLCRFLEDRVG